MPSQSKWPVSQHLIYYKNSLKQREKTVGAQHEAAVAIHYHAGRKRQALPQCGEPSSLFCTPWNQQFELQGSDRLYWAHLVRPVGCSDESKLGILRSCWNGHPQEDRLTKPLP